MVRDQFSGILTKLYRLPFDDLITACRTMNSCRQLAALES